MKTTGVVICNYNKCDYVINCIQSVLESKTDDYDLYVVDNASTDDSVEKITKLYGDKLTLIVNKENLGGSGGFNTGIKKVVDAGYKYVWCLDNDVLVDEEALMTLVEFLDKHKEAGMAGSKVYHMENPDYVQQFGMTISFDDFCVDANYLNWQEDGTMPEVVYSDAVAACSLLVRTSLIKEIGMMPEENFLYWDDTEWGYKCNLAGYKVASCGKSKVLHAMGAKKENVNTFPIYYAWRNWINFFVRYTPESKLEKMCESFIESIFEIVYGGYYRNEFNKVKTVMYAYDDALHGIFGKASPGKIFDIDFNESKLKKLVEGKKYIYIEGVSHEALQEKIMTKIKIYNPSAKFISETDNDVVPDMFIKLTTYIFLLRIIEDGVIYIDEDENILADSSDKIKVKNYNTAMQAFMFSQKPLFMMLANNLRNKTSKDGDV